MKGIDQEIFIIDSRRCLSLDDMSKHHHQELQSRCSSCRLITRSKCQQHIQCGENLLTGEKSSVQVFKLVTYSSMDAFLSIIRFGAITK